MRNTVLINNALDALKTVPSESVQCCVTSPPYWGLRKYGGGEVPWPDGWVGQLGREPDWRDYCAHLVEILGEVKRVLRQDGTLWLNLGDSYLNKELLGIPWRVVLGLQEQGWRLRSQVIWHKVGGMPENVSDRPTGSYEPIFMLTRSDRYFYDEEAVKLSSGARLRNLWSINPRIYKGAHSAVFPPDLPRYCILASTSAEGACSFCHAPYERELELVSRQDRQWLARYGSTGDGSFKGHGFPHLDAPIYKTIGWKRSCGCPDGPIEGCLVLDPFAGSGTTLQEAYNMGRAYLGVEVNPEALPEIETRLEKVSGRASLYMAQRQGIEVPL